MTKGRKCVVNIATAEELAEKLTKHNWCTCTGFRFGGILFLSDGGGETAVVVEETMVQFESITFPWCDDAKALDYIARCVNGTLRTFASPITNRIEAPGEHGSCWACA